MPKLEYAKYGKDNVRVLKVDKTSSDGVQYVTEMTVCSLLEGDIETSYTQADNKVVVPTDTQKQTVYILAKQNPVTPVERFAALVGTHFVQTYPHIHVANIDIIQHRWTRMSIDGKPHPYSFWRDGQETRTVKCRVSDTEGITIQAGIKDLLVLKSTGSAFYGYDTEDPYTVLLETSDRILSTSVTSNWTFKQFADLDEVEKEAADFDSAWQTARDTTFQLFAKENSPSVQNTMYKMSEAIIAACPLVNKVEYTLPNKHYFEINLNWFNGLQNTGKDASVYAPQSDPNGLIHCVVTRD